MTIMILMIADAKAALACDSSTDATVAVVVVDCDDKGGTGWRKKVHIGLLVQDI